MAGAGAAAEAAAGFRPSPPPPARRELFLRASGGASPRWWQRRLLRSAMPLGPGLGLLGLVFSHFCCGALAGVVVDPHVTAVWGKTVALKCVIDVNGTIIMQVSWEKICGKSSQTVSVHHPEYGIAIEGKYRGRVAFKSYSVTDATIILKNVSFSDAGKYVCKAVTFPLGNTESSTTVSVLVEPVVSLTKGPDPPIDGANRTIAATCTAATGKPAARIDWEGGLGEMESTSTLFPNETVTVVSHYVIVPTRFARGRCITCVVRHPAFEKEIRYPYVLDIQYPPTTTTRLPTVPWHPSTDGTTSLATKPVLINFPTSTLPTKQDVTWDITIGFVVGEVLVLLILGTLVGFFCYKRRKTFCSDYFANRYIPPSGSYPGSIKKRNKAPNELKGSEDPEKPELNNIDNTKRYQDCYEKDYEEGGTFGMGFRHGEFYKDDDFVYHLDGALMSQRLWYV